MMKRLSTLLTAVVFLAGSGFAGVGVSKKDLKTHRIDDGAAIVTTSVRSGGAVVSPEKTSAISWVAIDSASNAFGWASTAIQPLAYDPPTNSLVFIHRGTTPYGASGQLWYNLSTDGGATWRRVSELNAGQGNILRYPSAAISNPNASNDPANALFVWAAPSLDGSGGSFGGAKYGVDAPLGAGAPTAFSDFGTDTTLSSNATIWTGDNGSTWVYWLMRQNGKDANATTDNSYYLWTTSDYSTINKGVPAGWQGTDPTFEHGFGSYITGKYHGGASYLGFWSVFYNDADSADYNVGYTKSTDNGATWSTFARPTPSYRSLPGVGTTKFWLGVPTGYAFDMVVDANAKVHFIGVVQDTLTKVESVLEVYEGASGWATKVIQPTLDPTTQLTYGTLNQTARCIHASISPDGNVIGVGWIDNSGVANDTLPDIWYSHRSTSGNWSTPANITASPNEYDALFHAAPQLKALANNQYTVFMGRGRSNLADTWPPNESGKSRYEAGSYTFTQAPSAVGDKPELPSTFALKQNYPNPFNPSTKISYTVPAKSDVRLSVSNILGQEVATLVNEVKEAGTYDVNFSAAKLTSGVYFYTMKAGQYTETRKMVLMK